MGCLCYLCWGGGWPWDESDETVMRISSLRPLMRRCVFASVYGERGPRYRLRQPFDSFNMPNIAHRRSSLAACYCYSNATCKFSLRAFLCSPLKARFGEIGRAQSRRSVHLLYVVCSTATNQDAFVCSRLVIIEAICAGVPVLVRDLLRSLISSQRFGP